MIVNIPFFLPRPLSSKAWGAHSQSAPVPGKLGAKDVTGICLSPVGKFQASNRGEAIRQISIIANRALENIEI